MNDRDLLKDPRFRVQDLENIIQKRKIDSTALLPYSNLEAAGDCIRLTNLYLAAVIWEHRERTNDDAGWQKEPALVAANRLGAEPGFYVPGADTKAGYSREYPYAFLQHWRDMLNGPAAFGGYMAQAHKKNEALAPRVKEQQLRAVAEEERQRKKTLLDITLPALEARCKDMENWKPQAFPEGTEAFWNSAKAAAERAVIHMQAAQKELAGQSRAA